jgi:hypothetical protein
MQPRKKLGTGKIIALISVVVLLAGGGGFLYKLFEFIRSSIRGDLSFAVVHVVTYVIVALGFITLFVSAVLGGQLRDLEGPKYRLLEREAELDARERRGREVE